MNGHILRLSMVLPWIAISAAQTSDTSPFATPGSVGEPPPVHLVAPARGGMVSGSVVDGQDQPLTQCRVELESVLPSAHQPRPTAFTDASGQFRKSNVPWGTYNIGTTCHDYPDSLHALYTGHVRQTVTLSPEASSATVHVVRADRAGRIVKINVIDGTTGKRLTKTDPVSGDELDAFSVGIYRADNLRFGLEGGLGSTIPVPAQIPVIVKVYAAGYSTWYYGGAPDAAHAKPLILSAGQEISLDVMLQPLPQQ